MSDATSPSVTLMQHMLPCLSPPGCEPLAVIGGRPDIKSSPASVKQAERVNHHVRHYEEHQLGMQHSVGESISGGG
jgi:hypothetical protein